MGRHTGSGYLIVIGVIQGINAGSYWSLANGPNAPPAATAFALIYTICALIFVGLGIWGRWVPLPAAIAALVVYVVQFGLLAFLDPAFIARTIIFKVIIIISLFRAIMSARS